MSVRALALSLLLAAAPVWGETPTAGAVRGVVTNKVTGDVLAGVTVVATSPALSGDVAEGTDDTGAYHIAGLPEGTYTFTFIYGDSTTEIRNRRVDSGKTIIVPATIDVITSRTVVIKQSGCNGGGAVHNAAPHPEPLPLGLGVVVDAAGWLARVYLGIEP